VQTWTVWLQSRFLELFRKFNKEEDQTIVMVAHEDWHMEYVDRVIRFEGWSVGELTNAKLNILAAS